MEKNKPAIFDKAEMLARVDDDQDLLVEIVEIFLEDAPIRIDKLKQAMGVKDLDLIEDQAHALKGASANISAHALQQCAMAVEQAVKQNDTHKISELIAVLEDEYTALKAHLSEHM
ncbi:MAG: Hpt domain-containing protein [Desulfobacterales bacterium]|nr:Hpt domain-containing protein [Desulfobacterales bacterium]